MHAVTIAMYTSADTQDVLCGALVLQASYNEG